MSPHEMEQIIAALDAHQARRTRRLLMGVLLIGALAIPGTMLAASITMPNTFQADTVAHAAQVNANFAVLATEATRVSNIVQGAGDGGNNNSVVNLSAPIGGNDAANKAYVDAAGSGSPGASVTLWGTTTCPTGWTVAVVGTPVFPAGQSTGVSPATPPICAGAGVKMDYQGLETYVNSLVQIPGWSVNTSAPTSSNFGTCVVCVE